MYKHSRMLCLALPPRLKVQNFDFQSEFFLVTSLFFLKSGPIFEEVSNLGKAFWDAYNWQGRNQDLYLTKQK